MEEILESK